MLQKAYSKPWVDCRQHTWEKKTWCNRPRMYAYAIGTPKTKEAIWTLATTYPSRVLLPRHIDMSLVGASKCMVVARGGMLIKVSTAKSTYQPWLAASCITSLKIANPRKKGLPKREVDSQPPMSRAYVRFSEGRWCFLHGLLDECCTDATSPRMADEAFLFFRSFEGNLYQHTPKRDTHCKPCQLKEEIVYSSCWQSVSSLSSWKQHIDMFFNLGCIARHVCYTTKDNSMLHFCTIHYPVIFWDSASFWSLHHPQHQITLQNTEGNPSGIFCVFPNTPNN